jgi:hypothetical protein
MCYYEGRGTDQDLLKAYTMFEKAAAQNEPNAAFLLSVWYQQTDSSLSAHYLTLAKMGVWSSERDSHALTASEHFAKWHYLNDHQQIIDGFRDVGRAQGALGREVMAIVDSDPDLQSCVSELQQILKPIPCTCSLACCFVSFITRSSFLISDQWTIRGSVLLLSLSLSQLFLVAPSKSVR